jgi:hypothetical protein
MVSARTSILRETSTPTRHATRSTHYTLNREEPKNVHHPVVGDLDLTFQAMDLASNRGLQMIVFSAEPGSPTHDRLQLLGNLAMTNSSSAGAYAADPNTG